MEIIPLYPWPSSQHIIFLLSLFSPTFLPPFYAIFPPNLRWELHFSRTTLFISMGYLHNPHVQLMLFYFINLIFKTKLGNWSTLKHNIK